MIARRPISCCWLLLGGGLWLVAGLFILPATSAQSLDAFLGCLETNGVLADRAEAVRGGQNGILLSIDPEAIIDDAALPASVPIEGNGSTSAVTAVELWPENLAYIKVSGLVPGSGDEIRRHIESLNARGGLLLDFRGARGDDLDSACLLAGLAHHRNEPLLIITNNRGVALATNTVTASFSRVPLLMVLIDEGTAGASEALVALLKGGGRVMLVGSATKGDPCLRHWVSLPDGRKVKIATQKWITVSGKPDVQGGVRPDIEVKSASSAGDGEVLRLKKNSRVLSPKSEADKELMMRVEGDAALQRATDILLGLQALGGYGRE